jgi:hypothetical protein
MIAWPLDKNAQLYRGMSAWCQSRPNALQQKASLFNHLVGAGDERRHITAAVADGTAVSAKITVI